MKIKINKVKRASSKEWDQIWANCLYATYFHSREWAEIWNVYKKGSYYPVPKLISFSDGRKAIIPLSYHGKHCKGLIKDYISSPVWTYGGWISEDNLGNEHALLLSNYMLNKCGNLYWRVNPYDPNLVKTEVEPLMDFTHVLDLSLGSGRIIKGFSRGNISSLHKAQRHGVTVRIASTIGDWQEYFTIYEDSLSRWGEKASSRYGWELFNEIFKRNSPDVKLWLAVYQDKIISGALCFYSKRHVVYWHGATLASYFDYRPANLLMHEIIMDSCSQGYSWFDFNPSGGHKGVIAFKESFGTRCLNCPVYEIESGAFRKYIRVDELIGRIQYKMKKRMVPRKDI
ncbi:MAG: GNAT family N-acetyltransferase [bacterium]|nr:GNAT family N-acetyltransferase [bacterium]MDD5757130.1 GNAT family N-acetyltransferase [bacterium]